MRHETIQNQKKKNFDCTNIMKLICDEREGEYNEQLIEAKSQLQQTHNEIKISGNK